MDDVIKIALLMLCGLGIPMGLYLGFRAAMATIRQMERPPAIAGALDEQTVAEFDRMRQELAELHERMDFAERLLAQKSDVERLPG
jgi:hypothetical protein